ncbi:hypothetical protein SLA2020_001050 [Shorea laevis]
MESFPDIYPLKSLQIGNIKSYLSQTFLFFTPVSHKILILVDNQSWRMKKHSRSTHLRELMSTKYRMSPFRNNRTLVRSPSLRHRFSSYEKKNLCRWLPIISMATLKENAPFSLMSLYKALHGFIVFEVAWTDVHGINYLNVLQTDASLALEVKSLRKWEFNGVDQALSCISSWFSGTPSEAQTLGINLMILYDRVPSCSPRGITVGSKELLFCDASQAELFSEDVFFDVRECCLDTDEKSILCCGAVEPMYAKRAEPMEYKHTLLLFRFNDRDLPFKLKQIIMSDIKLLALLEQGLPSWVIFLQSYPLFCKMYRHWMRPLMRTLYILISLITVVIGFYDLYKNVPLLKAAASHLCGPLFKWIEAWDMLSRMRYLGTILFLQNLEKAVKWFLIILQFVKFPMVLLTRPLMQPLKEIMDLLILLWSFFAEKVEEFYLTVWVLVEPLCSLILDFVVILFMPFVLLYSYILSLVTLISPLFHIIWELFLVSIQGCLLLANSAASLFSGFYQMFKGVFTVSTTSMNQLTYLAQVTPKSSEISHWHSLWNDLNSKVFRSLRNVINGLVAFISSCSPHRFSIYSRIRDIFWQLCHVLQLAPRRYICSRQQEPQAVEPKKQELEAERHHKVEIKHCKQD